MSDDSGLDDGGPVDSVPDESGTGLEAVLWAAVFLVGLAAFVWEFGNVLLAGTAPAAPTAVVHDFRRTLFLLAMLGGGTTVALVTYAVFAFATGRRDAPEIPQVGQGRYLMSLFTIGLTFLMLTTMFIGAATLARTDEATAQDAAEQLDTERSLDVRVVGAQWAWRYEVDGVPYAQHERVVLPSQTLISLRMTSGDVIHSFTIQELGVKKDVVPGQENAAWFAVEEVHGETTLAWSHDDEQHSAPADTYRVNCAELCGKGHSTMVGTVVVVSPKDYEEWVGARNGTVPESFHGEEGEGDGHGGH